MADKRKKFKSSPKRFHPKGTTLIYEDYDILVIDKRSGLLTMSNEKVRENTAYFMLNEYVRKGNYKSKARIFIVHRLDRDTSGLLVFAKSPQAQNFLQEEWHCFTKTYHAVVNGAPREPEGVITSFLTENKAKRMYSTKVPDEGKESSTRYKWLRSSPSEEYSLLEMELITGRKNQIRVHLADIGCPVAGDRKYGDEAQERHVKRLALHASSMTIIHPHTREEMTFNAETPKILDILMKK